MLTFDGKLMLGCYFETGRCAKTSSRLMTSPYFPSMSTRLASCCVSERSPTHSRGTMARKPYWRASTHRGAHTPARGAAGYDDGVDAERVQSRREGGAEESTSVLLDEDHLRLLALQPGVDVGPARAVLEKRQRWHLREKKARLGELLVVRRRRVKDGNAGTAGAGEHFLRGG